MEKHSEVFIGLDVAKARHAVAVAEDGRQGEVRYVGEIGADTESVRRLVAKLEKRHGQLHFCYEAGLTGYGLHRQLTTLGHRCTVVAPSLIPRKPGDRVKTNRRDALQLARLLRAGELTAVWVPDEAHEAMRDLVRARQVAVDDIRRKRQAISSMMLRLGRTYPGKKTWGARHVQWLQAQRFDQIEQYVSIKYTERLADAGIEPSVGSVGDSYDDALAETINGLYKAEVIHRRGPWRSFEAVEFATLEWVDWFNNRRLLEPIGNIPPAEAENRYYDRLERLATAA
jgi:transposase